MQHLYSCSMAVSRTHLVVLLKRGIVHVRSGNGVPVSTLLISAGLSASLEDERPSQGKRSWSAPTFPP